MHDPDDKLAPSDGSPAPIRPIEESSFMLKAGAPLLVLGLVALVSLGLRQVFHLSLSSGVDEMLRHLNHDDPSLRELAAFEIMEVGRSTTPADRKRQDIDGKAVREKLVTSYRAGGFNAAAESYLVLALGYWGTIQAVPDLVDIITHGQALNARLRESAMTSLGELRAAEAVPDVIEALENEDDVGILKAGLLALGHIGDTRAVSAVKPMLQSKELQVQWSASIALAQLGDPSGRDQFHQMLNRRFLDTLEWPESSKEGILIEGVRAVARLGMPGFADDLEQIADSDPNLKVRSEAMIALREYNSNLP